MDLSILIPARNEMFLEKTIQDLLAHIEADTEIIAVVDGDNHNPPIPQNDRLNVIYLNKSIGQRAATNMAAKLSKAKYVMKVDAHCAFEQGFDRKMLEAFKVAGDNVTMVPIMRNLWAFDWKCLKCGKKWYQGPTPTKCQETNFKNSGKPCDSTKFVKKMMWIGKHNPQSTSYCFDSTPHFQYFEDWKHRPAYEKDKAEKGLTESMSLQGSCWMLTRDKYWKLNVCDEEFGSWGSQGIEVAVKTWLSGGRVLVNHKTWYAHMFRTQGGDFSFPYKISGRDQEKAKAYARELFFNHKWESMIHPLSWLLEKFWPVKGWTDADLAKLKENESGFTPKSSAKKTSPILRAIKSEISEMTNTVNSTLGQPSQKPNDALEKPHTLTAPNNPNKTVAKSGNNQNTLNNAIQIREGNNLVTLEVNDQTKINSQQSSRATVYSIEPSNGIIYFRDSGVEVKIIIEKSDQ